MPQHHFSMISNICRCCAECKFSAWQYKVRKTNQWGKASTHYRSKGHTKTNYIPWVWEKLFSLGHECVCSPVNVFFLCPSSLFYQEECCCVEFLREIVQGPFFLVLLSCSLIFKCHGPDLQLKQINMLVFEASKCTLIYTSWRLRPLVAVLRLLLGRSLFATLVYLRHWALLCPAQFHTEGAGFSLPGWLCSRCCTRFRGRHTTKRNQDEVKLLWFIFPGLVFI